jgi:NAD(P)H-hydrate epimerase
MRILNTKQIRELDAYTIEHEPVASIDLMERASRAFVDWFTARVDTTRKVGIVCGTGNNGGDGLAIARMLHDWGYAVSVWIVRGGVSESQGFTINFGRLPNGVSRGDVVPAGELLPLANCDVVIDALFGSGLSRPVEGLYAKVIDVINASSALRIAVDIPSGLMADSHSSGSVVKADYTVSFQLPKLAFFMPEAYRFTGEWVALNIGLNKKFIKFQESPYAYTTQKDVASLLKVRAKFDHKGTYGHALLISGSYGKMGAAVLASRACLRAGVGLLTVHVPESGYAVLQTAVPEAMTQVDNDPRIFSDAPDVSRYDALGIGPGLGQDDRTVKALAQTLENFQKPVVLDADALNILGANRQLMHLIPKGSILTPHPKEFERLTGAWKDDFERLEMLRQLATSLKSVVVLKGAHTAVATGNTVHFNSTGNPGMATGGTGDVLTGVLTGLLAQNYSPHEAAIAGVFLHGLAGDLAADDLGVTSLTAGDVVKYLPSAIRKVSGK